MFKNSAWTTIAVPDGLKGKARQLHVDRKGGIWLIANNSARFDGIHWHEVCSTRRNYGFRSKMPIVNGVYIAVDHSSLK
jgi:hypothetical protein